MCHPMEERAVPGAEPGELLAIRYMPLVPDPSEHVVSMGAAREDPPLTAGHAARASIWARPPYGRSPVGVEDTSHSN